MKCKYCDEEITENNNDDILCIANLFAHLQCYINYVNNCKKKVRSEIVSQRIEKYKEAYREHLKKTKEKNIRIKVTDFIFEKYDITFLPKYFYIKLSSVYDGTMQGLKNPIPPCDLLDMWEQQMSNLNKIAERNAVKGKKIEGTARINYDLAILISRHGDYLKWKERKRIQAVEVEESYSENKTRNDIATQIGNSIPSNQPSEQNKINIASLIDEI